MAARGLGLLTPPPTPALLSPRWLGPRGLSPRGLSPRSPSGPRHGLGRLERKTSRTEPALTRDIVQRWRKAVDVEAQVACVAEKHGVGQRWAATQLAWKVRVQAIRMNEVGETAWCNLLHTHGHSCAAGTFQNDDALGPDGRDAHDRSGCSSIEGVERPPREVDVVPL